MGYLMDGSSGINRIGNPRQKSKFGSGVELITLVHANGHKKTDVLAKQIVSEFALPKENLLTLLSREANKEPEGGGRFTKIMRNVESLSDEDYSALTSPDYFEEPSELLRTTHPSYASIPTTFVPDIVDISSGVSLVATLDEFKEIESSTSICEPVDVRSFLEIIDSGRSLAVSTPGSGGHGGASLVLGDQFFVKSVSDERELYGCSQLSHMGEVVPSTVEVVLTREQFTRLVSANDEVSTDR